MILAIAQILIDNNFYLLNKCRRWGNIGHDHFMLLFGLCPNCARQGQIFPSISKRNQKFVEKVEWNQLVEIIAFLNSKIPALRIHRPQVRILPGVPSTLKRSKAFGATPFLY
jgi:hypothetical protein